MAVPDSDGRCACSQSSSAAKARGTFPSTAISDRIRRNCRSLNPSGLPKSPSPNSRHATLCNAARVSTNDSPMPRRSLSSPLGAGVDSVMTTPSTKSMTKTGTSSSSPAVAMARTRGVGTSVFSSAAKSRASRNTSWAPGGSGGGGGRRTTIFECPSDTRNVRLECPSPMAWAVMAGPHSLWSARNRPSCWSWSSDHDHITCPGLIDSPGSFPANVSRTVPHQQLGRFLADHRLCGPAITAQAIGDGHSNLTFLVSDGHSKMVVRRPPPPPLPPGAHDVLREARLLAALEKTEVPTPRVRAIAAAGELLDVPVFVMDFVDGVVITESTPAPSGEEQLRRRIGESLVDTLASLHKVAWRELGLGDFGKPDGFNERQLRRMRSLIAVDGNVPRAFAALDDWLHAHLPSESGTAIVHNDFRIGNMIVNIGTG